MTALSSNQYAGCTCRRSADNSPFARFHTADDTEVVPPELKTTTSRVFRRVGLRPDRTTGDHKENFMRPAGADTGFTLVEILVAIAILLLVVTVTYGIFSATTKAWQRGKVVSESLQHGDFVMEQLVMGLRSTYYRDDKSGFWLTDGGQGSSARDTISWVKLGPALVGTRSEVAKGAHRVQFTVENDGDHPAAVMRAWSPESYLQPDNFNADLIDPVVLSRGVVGFSCRVGKPGDSGEIEWIEEWETTNLVPRTLELTLYLRPLKDDDEPTEMRRCVSIPVGNADAK